MNIRIVLRGLAVDLDVDEVDVIPNLKMAPMCSHAWLATPLADSRLCFLAYQYRRRRYETVNDNESNERGEKKNCVKCQTVLAD